LFRADIKLKANTIVMKGGKELVAPAKIAVPGDISSAAFFMVLAAITAGSRLTLKDISLNPSRSGIIKVLKRMGADIKVKMKKLKGKNGEPMGDIIVKSSKLRGTRITAEEIPCLIDEIPVLMVAASTACGVTVLENISELRFKETDRISSISENLQKMGAVISILKEKGSEKILVRGVKELRGTRVKSFGDHRTAMSMVIAGMAANGKTAIDDVSCINKSLPGFLTLLDKLIPTG
jgi:3-phosphoshikimate 1-carboxyvinyltransferase